MRKLVTHSLTITLLLAFLVSLGRYTAIQVNYWINKAEIIELFCINKEKPEMHCDGKCHLKDTFEDIDQNKEEKNSEESREFHFSLVVLIAAVRTGAEFRSVRTFANCAIQTEKSGYPHSLDRPPGALFS